GHVLLERESTDLHDEEPALILSCGYVENEAALSTLTKHLPCCVAFSDVLDLVSMIEGVHHFGTEKQIFRHNDRLDQPLAAVGRPWRAGRLRVPYSLDADIGCIREICDVAGGHGIAP